MDNNEVPNGAIEDNRPIEEKIKDYTHEEILGGYFPTWVEKSPKDFKHFSIRNQITSSSCGAQSGAKALESFMNVPESASPIYRNRSNYPDGGMYIQEIGSILKNVGTTNEALFPSENMTEEQLNGQALVTNWPYKIGGYYTLPHGQNLDMDLLAEASDKGHALVILIRSSGTEYGAVPALTSAPTNFAHFVCCVPSNYTLWKGEKSLVIDDSCAPHSTLNQGGQRIFTESWLKQRSWGILGLIRRQYITVPVLKYNFQKDLVFGMKDPDVVALQNILKFETCMPDIIPSTGYFGTATLAGVIKLQNKYYNDIIVPAGLSSPTGKVGKFTRQFLNSKYD